MATGIISPFSMRARRASFSLDAEPPDVAVHPAHAPATAAASPKITPNSFCIRTLRRVRGGGILYRSERSFSSTWGFGAHHTDGPPPFGAQGRQKAVPASEEGHDVSCP